MNCMWQIRSRADCFRVAIFTCISTDQFGDSCLPQICNMLGLLLIFVSPCDSRYSSSAFVWHVLSCADHDDNDDGPQVCPESFGLNMAPNRHRLRSRIVKATW